MLMMRNKRGAAASVRTAQYRSAVQAVQRAADILLLFAGDRDLLGITELSSSLGLPKSTTQRLVSNLVSRGLLEQDRLTRKYRLGFRVVELGMRAWQQLDLVRLARPHLKGLADRTGETVVLGVPVEDQVMYLDRIDSPWVVRPVRPIGTRIPAHCSALGKALLASLPDDELRALLGGRKLPRYTPNTLTEFDELLRHLRLVRSQGYAVDNEEFEVGLKCVGVPVHDLTGHALAAISLSGPTTRLSTQKLRSYIPLVVDAGKAICLELGCRGDHTGIRPLSVHPPCRWRE